MYRSNRLQCNKLQGYDTKVLSRLLQFCNYDERQKHTANIKTVRVFIIFLCLYLFSFIIYVCIFVHATRKRTLSKVLPGKLNSSSRYFLTPRIIASTYNACTGHKFVVKNYVPLFRPFLQKVTIQILYRACIRNSSPYPTPSTTTVSFSL